LVAANISPVNRV